MPINFNCPACGRVIAAEVSPGTQVRCPLCNQVVVVPVAGGAPPPAAAMQGDLWYAQGGQPPSQGMAIGALVCGIVGLVGCPLVGVVGLVLGIVALSRISRQPRRYGGRGLAIGGTVTGALSIVMLPLAISILLPSLSRARELSKRTVCAANMRAIGQALYSYAQEDGMFPEAGANWTARLLNSGDISPKHLICPSSTKVEGECSYVYVPGYGVNSNPRQVLIYEPLGNHNGEGGNILYVDGSVRFVKQPAYLQTINAIKPPDEGGDTGNESSDGRKSPGSKDKKPKEEIQPIL